MLAREISQALLEACTQFPNLSVTGPRQSGKTTLLQQRFQYYQRGALFENFAITELLKNRWNQDRHTQLFFWQDSNGIEVDLVELNGLQTHLYEMKYSQTPSADFFKGIRSFRKSAPPERQQGESLILYAGDARQPWMAATILPWRSLPDL